LRGEIVRTGVRHANPGTRAVHGERSLHPIIPEIGLLVVGWRHARGAEADALVRGPAGVHHVAAHRRRPSVVVKPSNAVDLGAGLREATLW
jgi:hypothetical protein